jgi:hypothetical protein
MEIKKGFLEITVEESKSINDIRFLRVNYPEKEAIKIDAYYDKLKERDIQNIKSEIQSIVKLSVTALNLLTEREYFEKGLVVMYSLLKNHDFLIVTDAGFSYESICIYRVLMNEIIEKLGNKSIYFVRHKHEKVKINFTSKGMRYYL